MTAVSFPPQFGHILQTAFCHGRKRVEDKKPPTPHFTGNTLKGDFGAEDDIGDEVCWGADVHPHVEHLDQTYIAGLEAIEAGKGEDAVDMMDAALSFGFAEQMARPDQLYNAAGVAIALRIRELMAENAAKNERDILELRGRASFMFEKAAEADQARVEAPQPDIVSISGERVAKEERRRSPFPIVNKALMLAEAGDLANAVIEFKRAMDMQLETESPDKQAEFDMLFEQNRHRLIHRLKQDEALSGLIPMILLADETFLENVFPMGGFRYGVAPAE